MLSLSLVYATGVTIGDKMSKVASLRQPAVGVEVWLERTSTQKNLFTYLSHDYLSTKCHVVSATVVRATMLLCFFRGGRCFLILDPHEVVVGLESHVVSVTRLYIYIYIVTNGDV